MTGNGTGRRWLPALCVCGTLLFSALGAWQVQRLAWKRDLIARVDARIAADPVAAPLADAWASLDPGEAEYRKVEVSGAWLHDKATRVDALTELGAGYWILTPLRTADGIVLVNRGFVPRGDSGAALPAATETRVVGLMRAPEPGGRILRPNQPAADRWFSRDVAAIAAARGLGTVAPYFIDAGASPTQPGEPVGGLTVVHFRNAHLTYAITWFALAALCLAGLVLSIRERDRRP